MKSPKLSQPIYYINILTSNGSQKLWYFGEEIMLLCPQEMRGYGFIPGWYESGLMGKDPLKVLATNIRKET